LTTAGVTIALRDFIISFIGWFVLMGRNGISVGDWVEIDGTQGEVVEINTFHTVLLETGNRAFEGYPTGRRIVLMNKFAVESKYFNFTTAGQWLWDEILIPIPSGKEIRPESLKRIQHLIEERTRENTQRAQQEWLRITKSHGLTEFVTAPAVDLRSTATGLDLIVRHITSAQNRFAMRVRLQREILGILQLRPEIEKDQRAELSV
jgi:small-conductance mechanosensitive channel